MSENCKISPLSDNEIDAVTGGLLNFNFSRGGNATGGAGGAGGAGGNGGVNISLVPVTLGGSQTNNANGGAGGAGGAGGNATGGAGGTVISIV